MTDHWVKVTVKSTGQIIAIQPAGTIMPDHWLEGYGVTPDDVMVEPYMGYVTKDSGKREEYASGMRRDTQDGKPDFSLCFASDVPYNDQMLTRFAALMARGAVKYGERNWELSNSDKERQRFRASAMRHMVQWFCGDSPEEDHCAAVLFNLMAAERLR